MTKRFVAVTDSPFPNLDPATAVLAGVNAELALAKDTKPETILALARDADALLVTYAKVPAEIIDQLTRCKVIARFGIGVDSVDIDAATRKGIMVTNVPEYCEDEVSDHAMAMLLSLARKIPLSNRQVHAGTWSMPATVPIYRLRGKVLGLAGFGKIPRLVATKAQAFGMQVQTYDPYVSAEAAAKLNVKSVSLAELFATSDYISVHAPLTPETNQMFNAEAFRQMKRTALLVNTARGPLVDVEALADALDQKLIAGVALDVLPQEPPPAGLRLLGRENVILTPHTGFYSEEALVDLQTKAAQQVALVLEGKEPRYPVNLKALQAARG